MSILLIIGLVFGALVILYHQVKKKLLEKAQVTLSDKLKEAKNDADKKVADSTASYESFMDKLRKYRAKKPE